jgi:hypothetical protein
MAQAARISPKFPWDHNVSGNPFWDFFGDRAYKLERCFMPCYTQNEIAQMNFDDSLNETQKLEYLQNLLQTTLDGDQASLHDANYTKWRALKAALSFVEENLGHYDVAEKIGWEMYHNGLDGKKDMSALHGLGGLLVVRTPL